MEPLRLKRDVFTRLKKRADDCHQVLAQQDVRVDAFNCPMRIPPTDSKMRTEPQLREELRPSQAGREVVEPQRRLSAELDISVAEIAVMWILHQAIATQQPSWPLMQEVVDFYPTAMAAIGKADVMRGVRQSELRLIYFKALIVARTHPKPEIIEAIRQAESILDNVAVPRESSREIGQLSAESLTEDSDTLAHIAVALGHPSKASPV